MGVRKDKIEDMVSKFVVKTIRRNSKTIVLDPPTFNNIKKGDYFTVNEQEYFVYRKVRLNIFGLTLFGIPKTKGLCYYLTNCKGSCFSSCKKAFFVNFKK